MGKIVKVSESERKYLAQPFVKSHLWDREFIIYQWYDKDEVEKKTKLIIDLQNLTTKWVRVTKHRISCSESRKDVEYLTSNDVDISNLLNCNFVCKRRSLNDKISLDFFIRSNGECQILVENEGNEEQLKLFAAQNGLILEDVTENPSFRNTNMTTIFTEEDKNNLLFLIDVLRK